MTAPWKVVAGDPGLHTDGYAVARVVTTEDHDHKSGHCVAYVFARTERERERRARLVAAAPDLLDCTRDLARRPCETFGAEDLEPGCCAPCRARTALAKAGDAP